MLNLPDLPADGELDGTIACSSGTCLCTYGDGKHTTSRSRASRSDHVPGVRHRTGSRGVMRGGDHLLEQLPISSPESPPSARWLR